MKKRFVMFTLLMAVVVLTVACGGGGGGSNPAAQTVQGVTVQGRISGEGDLSGIPVYLLGLDAQVPPRTSIRASTLETTVDGQLYFSMTDASGIFIFQNVLPGTYNLIAKKSDSPFGSIRRNLSVSAAASVLPTDLELLLTATGNVAGQIQVPADFTNRQGIIAFLPGTSFSAYTDADGKFTIIGIPVGSYTVAFAAPGLMPTKLDNVSIGAGLSTSLPLVTLAKDASFFSGIIWKGELTSLPASPKDNWAYYNSIDKKAYIYFNGGWYLLAQDGQDGPAGPQGATGATGLNGIGIVWKGELAASPVSPQINWAYYDTTQKRSLIWDGSTWKLLALDGLIGPQGPVGPQGPQGEPGVSIVWKGSFATPPANPTLNWAYYNTADKKAYIFDGSVWQVMVQDGATGAQGPQGPSGISITWKGTLAAHPTAPQLNWAYYNSVDKRTYIWDGTTWQTLTQDGVIGPVGPQGQPGIGILWQGALSFPPANPQLNWAYYNTTDRKSYIWNGSSWQILAQDGNPVDLTAPVITNAMAVVMNTTPLSLRVSWTTNEDAISQVEYGLSSSYGSQTAMTGTYGKSHEFYLTGLQTGADYFYRVHSKDAAGNEAAISDTVLCRIDEIVWQKCLGGSGSDSFTKFIKTSDNAFVLLGNTTSNDEDVSGNHGQQDIWVAKLDVNGNILWQKCFGGSSRDEARFIHETTDGGYIVAGVASGTDGDVSDGHGNTDTLLVKLNSDGAIQWKKSIGCSWTDSSYSFFLSPNDELTFIVSWANWPGQSPNGDYAGLSGTQAFLKVDTSTGNILEKTSTIPSG